MPQTGPAPITLQPRPQVHRTRPQGRQPQPPTAPTEGKPPPRPDAPQPIPGHSWTTRQRHHAQKPGHHPRRPIPRKRPRSTRPEALFLHPSPAATGTPQSHQPHKKARSAPSAIPRQIHRAISAPVTAPFMRFCVNPPGYPQTPFLPFFHPPDTALLYPPRSYPDPRYSEAQ